MTEPKRWETKGGKCRWQPVRFDGAVLVLFCSMGGCVGGWDRDSKTFSPITYRWQWMAKIRGKIGSFFEARNVSRQWADTEEESQCL